MHRAGVKPWPRLFQNLRASRETELTKEYPIHVVCEWIGNSSLVAAKHYLQVTDEDFQRASQGGAESGARVAQNAAQQRAAMRGNTSQQTRKAPEKQGSSRSLAGVCDIVQIPQVGPAGLEPAANRL